MQAMIGTLFSSLYLGSFSSVHQPAEWVSIAEGVAFILMGVVIFIGALHIRRTRKIEEAFFIVVFFGCGGIVSLVVGLVVIVTTLAGIPLS